MHEAAVDFPAGLIWTIDDVLAPDECRALVARTEAIGYTAAPITTARGPVHAPEIRNNERVMLHDPDLAAMLFSRLAAHVPATLAASGDTGRVGLGRPTWDAVGGNELLRCYRYGRDQRFAPHRDGAFVRDRRERSFITLMVYLNDDFEGGETRFFDPERTVVPRAGSALLFHHPLLHEGCSVTRGIKYVIRSDVMYRLRDCASIDASV